MDESKNSKRTKIFCPKKSETEIISIRLKTDLLDVVNRKATSCHISRNEFIRQALVFAIDNM